MNKKLVALLLVCCPLVTACSKQDKQAADNIHVAKHHQPTKATPVTTEQHDAGGYVIGQKPATQPYYIDGVLLVNKDHPLPRNYNPGENSQARHAFNELCARATKSGFNLNAFSTFRSYTYQTSLYNNYVARDGQTAADHYSARPGFSEHQSGLAFDIGEVSQPQFYATTAFGETPAGKWLASHAHEFGFILRYPKGKETITGYQYEPWHFRYVGPKVAKDVYN